MLLFVVLVCCCKFALCTSPVAWAEEGKLEGTFYELPNGRIVNAFLGVPYAAAPVFENRFKLPTNGKNPLLDVMVYIHGGAFTFGTGSIHLPHHVLTSDDIVYININYRLGPLGFFSTGDSTSPGNFGLKDQVAALKWVQRNIINFGGNPASVTIVGCSAGGASVHYHFLSPLSDGLFQKGASLSGNVLHPWTLPRNVTEKSTHLAALIGCPIGNTKDMVECLRSRPARAIVEQERNFQMWGFCPFSPFGPVVEPESSDAFITSHPLELLMNGKLKDLPWMSSVTKEEGLYPAAEFIPFDYKLKELNDKWNEIAPNLLMYNYSVPEHEKDVISNAIKEFYFGDKPISNNSIEELVQLVGDRLFYNEIFDITKLHNLVTKSNVYCYKFSYRGKQSLSNVFGRNFEDYGVSHGDDESYLLSYFFEISSSNETEADKKMTKFISSIFINFMKTGNPALGIDVWKPLSKNQDAALPCLNINSVSDLEFKDISNPATSKFWRNTLPYEYSFYPVRRDEL